MLHVNFFVLQAVNYSPSVFFFSSGWQILVFPNVLKIINFSVWVFFIVAGAVCEIGHRTPQGSAVVWTSWDRQDPLRPSSRQQNRRLLHKSDRV